jgi:Leucine-rich repeat (LRR) protein
MSISTDCRSPDDWQAVLSRPLPPAETEALARHLESCEACAEAVDASLSSSPLAAVLRSQAGIEPEPPNVLVQGLIDHYRDLKSAAETATTAVLTPRTRPAGSAVPIFGPPGGPGELGRVGNYGVLKQLGAGGMGVVFLAEDTLLQRPVALKVMQPQMAADAAHRQRFLREARAAAAIEHDHIVPIYQVGEEKGIPFLAMKLLRGESLESHLREGTPVTPVEAARIGLEVALGLAAAHARGLIHRDIKPANIWLEEPHRRVKILDFGLARAGGDSHLTSQNVIVGTPSYMAPEQARCEPLDGRTDLFSLGVVLYRLLTGRLPFQAKDAVSTLLLVTSQAPKPVPSFNPKVPPALAELVMRLMEKDPARRPQFAVETARALTAVLESEDAAPPSLLTGAVPAAPRRRRALWIGLGAAAAVLLAGFVIRITTPDGKKVDIEVPDGSKVAVLPDDRSKAAKAVDDAWIKEVGGMTSEKQVAAVEAKLKELNPGFHGPVTPVIEADLVTGLSFSTNQVADISPLRALTQLQRLDCLGGGEGWGKLTDLRPLKGLPLRHLNCVNNSIADLAPLQGMPLESLVVWGYRGKDLTPLEGMRLRLLSCGSSDVEDLSPLAKMPLEDLNIARTRVSDLSPLRGMSLSRLLIAGSPVGDLSPLKGMPINTLQMRETPAADLSVLGHTPLVQLQFDYDPKRDAGLIRKPTLVSINQTPADQFRKEAGVRLTPFEKWCVDVARMEAAQQVAAVEAKLKDLNPDFKGPVESVIAGKQVVGVTFSTVHVADISPLRALTYLQRLDCTGGGEAWGKLTDIRPLRGLPLRHLNCANNWVKSLAPLRGMPLETLKVWGYRGNDLTPLVGMQLKLLSCGSSNVEDLSPLAKMPLEDLNIARTRVSDLSPLRGMSLKRLFAAGIPVRDLSPLKGMPINTLDVRDTPAADLSVLADMPLALLKLDYDPKRDADLIRKPSLKLINDKRAAEFRKEVEGK